MTPPPTTPRLPVDCARCGTRHYGAAVPACVFCGAPFRTGDERRESEGRR